MEREEMVRRVRAHYDSFWSGDVDDFDGQLSPEFVDAASPPGTPSGPEAVKEAARANQAAFPDMRVDFEDTVVEGHKVVVRARWQGTNTGSLQGREPTGRKVNFSGIVIWEFDGIGRIARRWAQVDMATMLRQLDGEAPAA